MEAIGCRLVVVYVFIVPIDQSIDWERIFSFCDFLSVDYCTVLLEVSCILVDLWLSAVVLTIKYRSSNI
jgi:hypothetical protein